MNTKKRSNREGTIYYVEKQQRWRAEITWFDNAGNKRKKSWTSQKKSEVKESLDKFKKQLLINGTEFTVENRTFRQFSEEWLRVAVKPKIKPTSYDRKIITLENQVYKYIGGVRIDKLTHSQIQNMINDLSESGLSYSTVKKAYEAVSGCMRYYRIKTLTSYNPCEGITLPELKKRESSDIKFFTPEERKSIVEEATRKYETGVSVYRLGWAFVLLLYSGMRVGELCALTWSDIDFERKTINICKNAIEIREVDENGKAHYVLKTQNSTKTRSGTRIIPMTEKAYNALSELQNITGDCEYIISSSNRERIRPTRLDRTFYQILSAIGLPKVGVHTLRHTFATMLFSNGCEVKIVSDLLGHSNTKITENIYIHLIQQQKVNAIASIDKYSD
jgi:integrase